MFYDFAITVAASTTEANATTQRMKLTKGVVHRLEIQFPDGCAGLAHVRILEDGHQFAPTNPSGNFASDGHTIVIDEHYELQSSPYSFKAVVWNDDDTYSHTIYVRVGVLRGEFWLLFTRVINGLAKFLKALGMEI